MCAGRATHQPTSNRGENLACRNVDSRRQQRRLFLKQNPLAPRDGSGGRPYADSSSTGSTKSESNLSVGFPVNKNSWARRSERF